VKEVRLVYPDMSIPFEYKNGAVSFELGELQKY